MMESLKKRYPPEYSEMDIMMAEINRIEAEHHNRVREVQLELNEMINSINSSYDRMAEIISHIESLTEQIDRMAMKE